MDIKPIEFQKLILQWYAKHGRKKLPWQHPRTSYRVWLSEVMLQQTQVATVIAYFERFIQRFPELKDLAQANIDEVLALWAGLGYYSRARNLHRCAQIILQDYNGEFPTDSETLQKLPGIGRSTAGAILSLSQNKPSAILDGNVKRVLTRIHAIAGYPGDSATQKQLWEIAEHYTPSENVAEYTQAMMDLGAMICTPRQPKCEECPVKKHCLANQQDQQLLYPTRKKRVELPIKSAYFLLLNNSQKQWLLEQRPPVGIWGGLWSLPECPITEDISIWCKKNYFCEIKNIEELPMFRHTFSHFHLDIRPIKANIVKSLPIVQDQPSWEWCELKALNKKGLPAPIKKLFSELNL